MEALRNPEFVKGLPRGIRELTDPQNPYRSLNLIFDQAASNLAHKNQVLISEDAFLAAPKTMCVTKDEIWVGYGYPGYRGAPGVSRFSTDGRLICHYQSDPIQDAVVYGLAYDGENIWLATDRGAFTFSCRSDRWIPVFPERHPLRERSITAVSATKKGIYFGSSSGVSVYNPIMDDYRSYDLAEPTSDAATDVCVDGLGRPWLLFDSATPLGAIYFEEGRFQSLQRRVGSYPQRMVNISDEYLAIGGSAFLAVLETGTLSVLKNYNAGLVRGIDVLATDDLWLIFFSTGSGLKVTYICRNIASLVRRKRIMNPERKYLPAGHAFPILLSQISEIEMIYDIRLHKKDDLLILCKNIYRLPIREFLEKVA